MKQKDQSRMHFCRRQTQGTAGGWESLRQCYWPRGVLVINCVEGPPTAVKIQTGLTPCTSNAELCTHPAMFY